MIPHFRIFCPSPPTFPLLIIFLPMPTRLLLLLLLLLTACRSPRDLSIAAEPLGPPPMEGPTRPPTLLVKPSGDTLRQPLRLAGLSVELEALAGAVRISLELTYQNRYDQELEGTFFFPLASGATIDSFALAIDGKLRPGVIVPREQGRQVFEQVVRERIDPALLEWRRGNAFQARVFPIPAGGTKRIRLGFTVPMRYEQGQWTYTLPLVAEQALDQFALSAQVSRAAEAAVTLRPADSSAQGIDLPLTGADQLRGQLQRRAFLPDHRLHLSYRPERSLADQPEVLLYEGYGGETWFVARVLPRTRPLAVPLPRRIGLLWDVSHSAATRDLEAELALLRALLDTIGQAEVILLPFRHQPLPSETFRITDGDSQALLARLRSFGYDGATHLGALPLDELACDLYLLASDGVNTWQTDRLAPPQVPLHAISSQVGSDERYLRRLATASGGLLVRPAQYPPQRWARWMLRARPPRFRVEATASEVIPPLPPLPGQPLLVAGRLLGDADQLRLLPTDGVGQPIVIALDKVEQLQGAALPRRLWAQAQLREFLTQPAPDPAQVTALAQAHGLVTPYTSLLVLDRVEDYLRFDVPPPPELAEAVGRARARQQADDSLAQAVHLTEVAQAFAERVLWWSQTFEIPDEPYQPPNEKKDRSSLGFESEDAFASEGGDDGDLAAFGGDGYEDPFSAPDAAPNPAPADAARDDAATVSATIELETWQADLPYVPTLQAAGDSLTAVYFQEKARYGQLPAFYADAATVCLAQGDTTLALQALSTLAELDPDNAALLRVLAYRLQGLDSLALAEWVLGEVLRLRPDEPQSYRDLGLLLARLDRPQAAAERLYEVVRQPWDGRFADIGVLVAHELNSLIGRSQQALDLSFVDPRLLKAMPTDLRVVLTWDANDTDMDLWVTDPRGEKCYYQNRRTEIGGLMSRDFTGGYGPEEFLIKRALSGTYRVQANYYGSNRASLLGPATLRLRLIRDYGRPSQSEKSIVLRLSQASEVVEVGRFEVK